MSLIDNEKKRIFEIAKSAYDKSASMDYLQMKFGDNKESFFVDTCICNMPDIQEYDFQSPMELEEKLEKLCDENNLPHELVKPIVVATFKLRKDKKEYSIPDTIYNF